MLNDTPPEMLAKQVQAGIEYMQKSKYRFCLPLQARRWQVSIRLFSVVINTSLFALSAYTIWRIATNI